MSGMIFEDLLAFVKFGIRLRYFDGILRMNNFTYHRIFSRIIMFVYVWNYCFIL